MTATENEPEVIILLIFASNWPIKETSPPRSFRQVSGAPKDIQI